MIRRRSKCESARGLDEGRRERGERRGEKRRGARGDKVRCETMRCEAEKEVLYLSTLSMVS